MAEQHDESQAKSAAEPASQGPGEGAAPAAASHPAAGEAGARPAESPPPAAASPGRFRRWSAGRPLQFVVVGLLAGLAGGLVGGGVVAAFGDDGHRHGRYVRIERGGPWGGDRFRPRYWGPPPGGQWGPPPVEPGNPAPSPQATG